MNTSFRRRFAFGSALSASTAAAAVGLVGLGPLGPFITQDLNLTRTSFGALGTIFSTSAALGSPYAGRFSDRIDGRWFLAASLATSTIALLLMALSTTYTYLLLAMIGGGIGAAAIHPVTNRLISIHIPVGGQAFIMGAKQSGVQIAVLLSGAFLPFFASIYGWRASLLWVSAVMALLLVVVVLVIPSSPGVTRQGDRVEERRLTGGLRRTSTPLTAYSFLMGAGSAAVGLYLVLYCVEDLAMTPAAGGIASAAAGAAAILSRVGWTWVSERLESVAVLLAGMSVFGSISILLIAGAPRLGLVALWLGVVAFGSTAGGWNAVAHLGIIRLVGADQTGRASGYLQAGFFGGLLVSPLLFGAVVDRTGAYGFAWLVVAILFVLAAAVASVMPSRRVGAG